VNIYRAAARYRAAVAQSGKRNHQQTAGAAPLRNTRCALARLLTRAIALPRQRIARAHRRFTLLRIAQRAWFAFMAPRAAKAGQRMLVHRKAAAYRRKSLGENGIGVISAIAKNVLSITLCA